MQFYKLNENFILRARDCKDYFWLIDILFINYRRTMFDFPMLDSP